MATAAIITTTSVKSVRAARLAGLRAGHVRFYVGTWYGAVIYRVSVSADRCWQYVMTIYDPSTKSVDNCTCDEWQELGVCAHAGAVLLKVGR